MTLEKRSFQAIYRFLDKFNPVDFDCGRLCGQICCRCTSDPDGDTASAPGDENADFSMGIYLLPGEEQIYDGNETWIQWGFLQAEEYEFPESWHGKVPFIQCMGPDHCDRSKRPLQCRTYPLAPHLTEDGSLVMIYQSEPLPYTCPLIRDSIPLQPAFVKASYTCWQHLIREPLIYDMVALDSELREEDGLPITILYP